VKAIASPAELRLNGSGDAVVRVTVQNGYHINANPSTFSYLIATELTMNPTAGISVSFIVYPDAITKSFSFADKPLAVYQGTTDIKVRLKADKSSPVGPQTFRQIARPSLVDDFLGLPYALNFDVTIPVSTSETFWIFPRRCVRASKADNAFRHRLCKSIYCGCVGAVSWMLSYRVQMLAKVQQ
jgi:hypothetical protein